MQKGIKISLLGTGIEAVGMALDILHHIDIGIRSPEGLLTPFHGLIFFGFFVNFIGVLITMYLAKKL